MRRKVILALSLALCAGASSVDAAEDKYGIETGANAGASESAGASQSTGSETNPEDSLTLTSTNDMGDLSASSLRRSAEVLTRKGQYDRAIEQLRQSLKLNYDDSDTHKAYAIALEKKMSTQVERDPQLFNQCVKEWLILLREEVGLEKLTFHGLNAPLVGSFFADETFAIPAKAHLQALTGFTPRAWETDAQYLRRVTRADSTGVSGKVLKKHTARSLDDLPDDDVRHSQPR